MGLLGKLLTLPVAGPIGGVLWLAEKLKEQAEGEAYDEDAVRGRLMALELEFDLGEITEDEYAAAEDELLARLREIREWRAARQES